MRASYEGSVSIPNCMYVAFRRQLEELPVNKRHRFRASVTDRWGCNATVLYDSIHDNFYEKASKRPVVDRTSFNEEEVVRVSELGAARSDEEVISVMAKLQLQNRSLKYRPKHVTVRVPARSHVNAY